MEKENTKIVEINGVKMQIDLRQAKVISEYKVGDNIKVLIKGYSDYKSYVGTIIGFDEFKNTPTIVLAYLKVEYNSAEIVIVCYNDKTEGIEITTLNDWDWPLTKSEVIENFQKEEKKKEVELQEIKNKQIMFEKLFGKYFEPKLEKI